jgi:hypothetical protein
MQIQKTLAWLNRDYQSLRMLSPMMFVAFGAVGKSKFHREGAG